MRKNAGAYRREGRFPMTQSEKIVLVAATALILLAAALSSAGGGL